MKRIVLILSLVCAVTTWAGTGEDDVKNVVKPGPESSLVTKSEFPNPILKLWKFLFKDYNSYTKKRTLIRHSDTTYTVPHRYHAK